ncbi:MAG: PEP-CTERM sorting domain-containing protein [Candidatus Omnitrophica bacterium]|nr:PEP-CTERM sorting domain-containing protein [Candidatus Omnitrophota bacterium]MCM8826595.1 PEP-CTERM sorting domain-containing protein [Candidatus Omnitrophota bacterium]
MRKLLGLLMATFGILCLGSTAQAISLPPGEIYGHLSDWSSLWRGRSPLVSEATPALGDEGRALAQANQLYYPTPFQQYWVPSSSEEIIALEYDFIVAGYYYFDYQQSKPIFLSSGTPYFAPGYTPPINSLWFIPGSRYAPIGGRIDIYLDTTPDFSPDLGPSAWIPGSAGVRDTYPTASDGVLWLTGTYAPLFWDVNLNNIRDPGEPDLVWFDLDNDNIQDPGESAVYLITGYDPSGSGTASAYIQLDGGSFYPAIKTGFLGTGSGYSYDMKLRVTLSAGNYGWAVTSSDPIRFAVIPEPSTIMLLGMGLLGCGLVGITKRKA